MNIAPGWYPAPPVSITPLSFLAAPVDAGNLTVYTYSVNLGSIGKYDHIFVGAAVDGPAAGATGLTVAGVAATLRIGAANTNNRVELWSLPYAGGGGLQNIVVTYATAANRAGIVVWGVKNLGSHTPVSSGSDNTSPHSVAVNVPAGGFALVLAYSASSTSGTPTNVTEDADNVVEAAGTIWGGSQTFAAAQTGLGVGVTFAAASVPIAIAASFG